MLLRVAREHCCQGTCGSLQQRSCLRLFFLNFSFVNKIYEHWSAHRMYEMYLIYSICAINQRLKLWKMLGFNRSVLKLMLEFEPNPRTMLDFQLSLLFHVHQKSEMRWQQSFVCPASEFMITLTDCCGQNNSLCVTTNASWVLKMLVKIPWKVLQYIPTK